ncbi:16S rRNA (adenine(1518)-N(6)/adenine(1519)-N(6))-dimethyltransferase RsmA [Rhodoblastus sp. 17X3]|uniref:16S rRNA (adenine(1518)-N(6)/adenine(1519)-N(6))- dimethyltransferase RsmA n=1 Tax=Rhodoblastus sp. 17X3 TaxID=3047026 RepID=UPI0024B7623B|nr:16S rRNA (adenine(1518)-N(6)/adenine(1519)-N(6))-dimethyltransferase RsmA [Rhodoblastus sp. 17X3]MDI9847199.1 16S rRNA (adenine(1518)-N(6)/adenine(1519)-N(6))-dimethyltransferase RsmA [Rhodoblastus sp. 17X3]
MSDSLPPLREVVARHGLAAKKSLGQNFLFDLNLTGKIARAAGPLDEATVLEIGPGPGGLTRALLANGAKKVIAVERDERCLAALEEIAQAYPGRLDIVPGDALALDYPAFLAERGIAGKVRICANLPYNIGTQLLAGWLSAEPWPPFYERMVLMFQREVAERIVATPRERADYGRLGVLAGWRSTARILFDVPPSAFTPPPKIVSSVVELRPREEPIPCDARALEMVTLSAFGQRRKMLRQSLKSLPGIGDPAPLLEEAGIEPTRRAEEIEVAGFCALARAYAARRG